MGVEKPILQTWLQYWGPDQDVSGLPPGYTDERGHHPGLIIEAGFDPAISEKDTAARSALVVAGQVRHPSMRGRLLILEAIAGTSGWVAGLSLLPLPDRVAFAQGVHARAKASPGLRTLNREQGALVTSIAEALLPRTETVGATDVGVTRFIDLLLTESMLERDRDRFFAGLAAIDVKSQSLHGAAFLSIHPQEQQSLLAELG